MKLAQKECRLNLPKNPKILLAALAFLQAVLVPAAQATTSWSSGGSWSAPLSEESSRSRRSVARSPSNATSPFSPGSSNIGIDIGQIFLMGDLTREYSDSIGSQIHFTYGVSEMFSFDSSLGFSSHADNDFSIISLLPGLRMNLAWYDKVIPYATFGLGFYKPSITVSPTNVVSPVLFGIHGGAGVNLEVTRQLFFGASLTLHDMFGTKKLLSNGSTLNVDGTYTSFLINAGVTF
jgi:hypothetical protein